MEYAIRPCRCQVFSGKITLLCHYSVFLPIENKAPSVKRAEDESLKI